VDVDHHGFRQEPPVYGLHLSPLDGCGRRPIQLLLLLVLAFNKMVILIL
jgi:hypothetical protein